MEKNSKLNNTAFSVLDSYQTLEEALKSIFGFSKNLLKKNLTKNQLQKPMKKGDRIDLPLNLINHGQINPMYDGPKVHIRYEDDLILVLAKPEKIHSHPLTYDESDNLLSYIRQNLGDGYLHVNKENYDRGLLYRLDFETSGLMIYVKNPSLHDELRNNFHRLIKEKVYLAKVSGKFDQEGLWEHQIKPSEERGHKMKLDSRGDSAVMEAHLKSYDDKTDTSIVEIRLVTGLRHQIRIQLASLGFPIIGDDLYGGEPANRLFLHAYRYEIKTKELSYELMCEPDEGFKNFL